jgi:hypothetical protein
VCDSQLSVLGACLTDEIMNGARMKQNDNGVPVQGKHTGEDMLALRNILHGSVVDIAGLCNDNLMTMWRVSDVALSDILLWHGALSSEVVRATTVEARVAGGGSNSRWCR